VSSPGLISSISTKAALSGGSSGGAFSQSRTRIDSVPKRTGASTRASNFDTRAVILSSPSKSATGSGVMSAQAAAGFKIANASPQPSPTQRLALGLTSPAPREKVPSAASRVRARLKNVETVISGMG
jgi:hypothetical protein